MIIAHGNSRDISKSNIINSIATKKNRTSNLCRGSANGANPQLYGPIFSASGFWIANTYDATHITIDITPAITIYSLISIGLFSFTLCPLLSFVLAFAYVTWVFRLSVPYSLVLSFFLGPSRPTSYLLYTVIRCMCVLKEESYVLILSCGNLVILPRTRRILPLFKHFLLLVYRLLIVGRLRI